MRKTIWLVALLIGSSLGLVLPAVADEGHSDAMPVEASENSSEGSMDEHHAMPAENSADNMSEMEHHHGMLEIPDDQPVPTVSLMLYQRLGSVG
ncbi:MAG: hypothetical protein F6J97_17525, partial [Leptolyngbya sp. SIO4C1]|nr:hypothetical protein [Leptolyngbya sp. SIO4C1]